MKQRADACVIGTVKRVLDVGFTGYLISICVGGICWAIHGSKGHQVVNPSRAKLRKKVNIQRILQIRPHQATPGSD